MIRVLVLVASIVCGAHASASTDIPALPEYATGQPVTGVIRIWTNAETQALLQRWQEGFQQFHPHSTFETSAQGSDVALAGLYTSRADIALLGRVADAPEIKAFEWIFRYKPEPVEVANGSERTAGRSPPLIAYVHASSPLTRLKLTQLDAAFGHERLLGAASSARTWGDLGVQGKWARQPINLYTIDTESGTGRYFREQVLGGSRKLEWDRVREFSDSGGIVAGKHDESAQLLQALARDPFGLGVTGRPSAAPPGVKELAMSRDDTYVTATRESLIARTYPLTRVLNAYVNRKPGMAIDSRVGEFLRYVLSRQGQQAVHGADDFLPLSPSDARRQMEKIR